MLLAVFGRAGSPKEPTPVAVPGKPDPVVDGGRAAKPYITLTRRDGREWVLTMDEVDHLIDTLTRLRKQYRRETGK